MSSITWDDIVRLAPLFTAVVVPVVAFLGRQALKSIHSLVNDRLDLALKRITQLEQAIKHGQRDPGSTAQSLRSKEEH